MTSSRKIIAAKKLLDEVKRDLGANLLALGVTGSVARGKARKYSDVDLLWIVKKSPDSFPKSKIIDDVLYTFSVKTRAEIRKELATPSTSLAEIIGGYSKIMPLYDPKGVLPEIEKLTTALPKELFKKSAELALFDSYEYFCKAKNAFDSANELELRSASFLVTIYSALIVAEMNYSYYTSDNDILTRDSAFSSLPQRYKERVNILRYGNLKIDELFGTLLKFYSNLVEFCEERGVKLPVSSRALEMPKLRK